MIFAGPCAKRQPTIAAQSQKCVPVRVTVLCPFKTICDPAPALPQNPQLENLTGSLFSGAISTPPAGVSVLMKRNPTLAHMTKQFEIYSQSVRPMMKPSRCRGVYALTAFDSFAHAATAVIRKNPTSREEYLILPPKSGIASLRR